MQAARSGDPSAGSTVPSELRPNVVFRVERRLGEGATAVASFASRFGPEGTSPAVLKIIQRPLRPARSSAPRAGGNAKSRSRSARRAPSSGSNAAEFRPRSWRRAWISRPSRSTCSARPGRALWGSLWFSDSGESGWVKVWED
ncbi:MAG TPA: hypothetical protein VGK73_39610 [Polyangiaceae bacterium]